MARYFVPIVIDLRTFASRVIMSWLRHRAWFHFPDVVRILSDRPVTRKPARIRNIQNRFTRPIVGLCVQFHQPTVCIKVSPQVSQVHVEVALRQKRVTERCKSIRFIAAEAVGESQVQRCPFSGSFS